jgi:lysophospholipase L1-like esterase
MNELPPQPVARRGRRRPDLTHARALLAMIVLASIAGLLAVLPGTPRTVGPRANYLALGDSVAYGFQPNFDLTNGYADKLAGWLQRFGSQQLVNMSCPGETSGSMLRGGCRLRFISKAAYEGTQTEGAVAFIRANRGRVSPVTLTIGANDIIDTLGRDCSENVPAFRARLLQFDRNLNTILGRLTEALDGQGDLILTTYYNPYQDACPNSTRSLRQLNGHITALARRHGARVVDIFPAFAGRTCDYTWMCSRSRDIHPTSAGYQVIAERILAVEFGEAMTEEHVHLR